MGHDYLHDDNYWNWSSDVSEEKNGIKVTIPAQIVLQGSGVSIHKEGTFSTYSFNDLSALLLRGFIYALAQSRQKHYTTFYNISCKGR